MNETTVKDFIRVRQKQISEEIIRKHKFASIRRFGTHPYYCPYCRRLHWKPIDFKLEKIRNRMWITE